VLWSRAVRAASGRVSLHGRGALGLRTLCPDLVAIHLWHSVGPIDEARRLCFNQADLAKGASSHCELPVFKAQVASIRRDFRVVSLAEGVSLLGSGQRGYGWCAALTFDDGFASTVASALPWLHAQGLPSTLFVNADLAARTRVKDVDLIIYGLNVLGSARVAAVLRAAQAPAPEPELAAGTFDFRIVVGHPAWPTAKQMLLASLGVSEGGFATQLGVYASWDALRAVPPSVTIGNHGAAHAYLPALGDDEIAGEIDGGFDAIRRELSVTDAPYAFAFGQPQDFPAGAERVARAAHTVVSSAFGGINRPGTLPHLLCRVPMFSSANDRLRAEYEFPPRTLLGLLGR
jgi:peptidoglycan/xylan/chitin deacetylase (PgdA/CDA1 family)